jgi:hypothetical protein
MVVARRPVMPKRTSEVLVAAAAEPDETTKPLIEPTEQADKTTLAPPPEPVDISQSPETVDEEDDSTDDEPAVVAVPLPISPEGIPDDDIADPAPIPDESETSGDIVTEDSAEEPEEMDEQDVLAATEDTDEDDATATLDDESEDSDPQPFADSEEEDDDVVTDDETLDGDDEDSDDSMVASVSATGGTPWQSITGWTSLGIGAAAIGAAVYTAMLAMNTVDEANALDAHSPNYVSQFKQHKTDAELYGLLTTIIMPVGGALVAAGVTLLLMSPDGATEPSISLDDTHRLRFNAVPHRHGIMVHTSINF